MKIDWDTTPILFPIGRLFGYPWERRYWHNSLTNMWFPWSVHWQDEGDARFLVRLRWRIIVSGDFLTGSYRCANLWRVWFGKSEWINENSN